MPSNKPKILFICRKQFGYSVDNYYHCKYLAADFRITYFSPYVKLSEIYIPGVNPVYVKFGNNRFLNNIRFYIKGILFIRKFNPSVVILNRSFFFFLFKIFHPRVKFIYDIRSGIVSPSKRKRFFYTLLIKLDLKFFKNVTVISDSLAKSLKIKKYYVLPLGAENFSLPTKKFETYSLVYTGVFDNRNIHETVEGFGKFINQYEYTENIEYHIYGFGKQQTEQLLMEKIAGYKLENRVFLHGRYMISELPEILNKHNVGVSYIPKTPYFELQPPTKTFEYLLAGMPVIATNTLENSKIINSTNGVLINDDPDSFKEGIVRLLNTEFVSNYIKKESQDYTWFNIVSNNLKSYIYSLLRT